MNICKRPSFILLPLILLLTSCTLMFKRPFLDAVEQGDASAVQHFLALGVNVNVLDAKLSGKTPIMNAARLGHKDVAEILLAHGADLHGVFDHESTPLGWAVSGGNKDIVKLLLDHGADIEERGGWQTTALMSAACHGDPHIVSLLLDYGADIDAGDWAGKTALWEAVFDNEKETAEVLLIRGADPDKPDAIYKRTPLMIAAEKNLLDIAIILLAHGANRNAENYEGKTAGMIAGEHGHSEIVHLLESEKERSQKPQVPNAQVQ